MNAFIRNGTDGTIHECLNVDSIEIKRDGSLKLMHVGGKVPRLFTKVTRIDFIDREDEPPCVRKFDRYQMETGRVDALHFVFSRAGKHLLIPSVDDEAMLGEATQLVKERKLYSPTTDIGDVIRPLRRTLARLRANAEKSRSEVK